MLLVQVKKGGADMQATRHDCGARRIEAPDDVRTVLGSPNHFHELLDCVTVAKYACDWELDEEAGTQLLLNVVKTKRSQLPSRETAAKLRLQRHLSPVGQVLKMLSPHLIVLT